MELNDLQNYVIPEETLCFCLSRKTKAENTHIFSSVEFTMRIG